MKFFIFFSTLLLGVVVVASRGYDQDQSTRCVCRNGMKNLYPFWVRDYHSRETNGRLGFELSCKNGTTIMQFPAYGDLVVKSISYSNKKLSLVDPKDCVAEVFLNLDLSLTPFDYYYAVKNYTYLNCSASLSSSFMHVPCLSGMGYYVYTVDSSSDVPSSCRIIKTVAAPFAYNPYIDDNSFGLGLTWGSRESKSFSYSAHIKVACFFGMVIVMLIGGMKIHYSKKPDKQQDKKSQVEAEELLAKF